MQQQVFLEFYLEFSHLNSNGWYFSARFQTFWLALMFIIWWFFSFFAHFFDKILYIILHHQRHCYLLLYATWNKMKHGEKLLSFTKLHFILLQPAINCSKTILLNKYQLQIGSKITAKDMIPGTSWICWCKSPENLEAKRKSKWILLGKTQVPCC